MDTRKQLNNNSNQQGLPVSHRYMTRSERVQRAAEMTRQQRKSSNQNEYERRQNVRRVNENQQQRHYDYEAQSVRVIHRSDNASQRYNGGRNFSATNSHYASHYGKQDVPDTNSSSQDVRIASPSRQTKNSQQQNNSCRESNSGQRVSRYAARHELQHSYRSNNLDTSVSNAGNVRSDDFIYEQKAKRTHNQQRLSQREQDYTYRSRSTRNSSKPLKRRGWSAKRIIAFLVIVALVVGLTIFFLKPGSSENVSSEENATASSVATTQVADALPTPIMAACDGVEIHSAVSMQSLTEVLIHNASYTYAKKLTTKLTEATNADVMASHGTGRIASEQPTGNNWMTGEFIRCYRSESAGAKLSAIDCGGAVGTTVYSPVTGTVVKVKKYSLYGNKSYPDYQIHIQPTGRPDLDVVLIHLKNVSIKEGEHVEAGQTPMAKIRDVYAYIGSSMQLRNYTAEGDNGNHTHIQVNNVNDKKYHGLD